MIYNILNYNIAMTQPEINIENIHFSSPEIERHLKSKKFKCIILIIASKGGHYDIFKKCWEQYMNNYEDVQSFFLYGNEHQEADLLISKNDIIYKCKESLIPGILYKTLASFMFCKQHLSYDFIIRTNLSSFIHIPRLLQYLNNQDKNHFIAGNTEEFIFINKNDASKYKKSERLSSVLHSSEILSNYFDENTPIINRVNDQKFFYFLAGSFFILS